MRTVKFIFFFFVGVIFFVSCTLSKVNEKLIIGKWKNGQIKSFVVDKKYASDTSFAASNKLRLGQDTLNTKETESKSLREFKQAVRSKGISNPNEIKTILKTEIDFKPDKTISIFFKKGKFDGTWKMNMKGNKVIVKDSITQKKNTIYIIDINQQELKISEKIPKGNLITSFKR
ncbi:MAG: hypothetical protein WCO93_05870 [bacterium]